MRGVAPRLLWILATASSALAHTAVYLSLPVSAPPPSKSRPPAALLVSVATKAPPPAVSVPKPPPEPPRKNEPPPAPKPALKAAAPPLPSPEPVAASPAEPAASLSGVTLLAEQGTFTAPAGDATPHAGPVVPSGRPRATLPSPVPEPARVAPPALVPLTALRQRPIPPDLSATLAKHYPPSARAAGRGGRATVLARIDPDGIVRSLRVQAASDGEFGNACRDTVKGSRWGAPQDRAGRPVAVEIRYTCAFRVDGW